MAGGLFTAVRSRCHKRMILWVIFVFAIASSAAIVLAQFSPHVVGAIRETEPGSPPHPFDTSMAR